MTVDHGSAETLPLQHAIVDIAVPRVQSVVVTVDGLFNTQLRADQLAPGRCPPPFAVCSVRDKA